MLILILRECLENRFFNGGVMNNIIRFVVLLCVVVCFSSSANAFGKEATCEEAKIMAEKAALYIKEHGIKASSAVLQKPPYKDRSLYVFAFDKNGMVFVHGGTPAAFGTNILELKDVMGVSFGKLFMSVKDRKWVNYKYLDPSDKGLIKDKYSYIINIDGNRVGVGCYDQPIISK